MEKRIKIVWALSLVSALVVIGVQGYLLLNEYRYTVGKHSQELADRVLAASEREYTLRKEQERGHSFIIHKNAELKRSGEEETSWKQIYLSMSKVDSADLADNPEVMKKMHAGTLRLSFDADLPEDSLFAGINRAMVNYSKPFREALLDSVLRASMPGVAFAYTEYVPSDTLLVYSHWEPSGTLFYPSIRTLYVYSPFERQGVWIEATVPMHPVFHAMGAYLGLSLFLVLLLIGCLVFQIRTILRQYKLGELRERFVNTMIHELKRPVQTLKMFVAFLGDREMRADEPAVEQVARDSMFELDNLSAYLNKLRDMLRAGNGETPLHLQRFHLGELMEKVARLAAVPSGKQVRITTACEMQPPWIEGDPVHIANVLSNLVENALKYSSGQVEIRLEAVRKGRELWLTVADNGIGIPYAEQEKVFAKFYRGTNGADRAIPGIGLGLSYVKLIAEAHHGRVSLRSRVGEGTTVTLCLPQ